MGPVVLVAAKLIATSVSETKREMTTKGVIIREPDLVREFATVRSEESYFFV